MRAAKIGRGVLALALGGGLLAPYAALCLESPRPSCCSGTCPMEGSESARLPSCCQGTSTPAAAESARLDIPSTHLMPPPAWRAAERACAPLAALAQEPPRQARLRAPSGLSPPRLA